jgi:hypothetical protein
MRLKLGTSIAGLLLLVMAAPAFAQNVVMHVNVPFAFTAGKRLLPAGRYSVLENDGATAYTFFGQRSATVLSNNGASGAAKHAPSLVFLQIGGEYSLIQIWPYDGETGQSVLGPTFNGKKMIAGTSKAQTVEVLALLR